jgi:hypothetical protein
MPLLAEPKRIQRARVHNTVGAQQVRGLSGGRLGHGPHCHQVDRALVFWKSREEMRV